MLRRSPLGERDDLLLLLGRETGRFSAVSKGTRGSQRSGLLEPPVELEASFFEGATLDSLRQPALTRAFAALRGRLDGLLAAGFLCRLFAAALPEKARVDGSYELLGEALTRLSEGVVPSEVALFAQSGLLRELGVAPALDGCVGCGNSAVAGFSAVDGGLLCSKCYGGHGFAVSSAVVATLRAFDSGHPSTEMTPTLVREVGRVYKHQLKHHLDLPDRLFRPVLPQEGSGEDSRH